jgi:eukaryotic-like serine/threonine-protein kinase
VEVARGEQRVVFSLPPGRHVLRLEHECCAPWERAIDADDAARTPELKVPLEPRPARLRVEGDPATRIYLGNRLLGTAGDSQRSPIQIQVPSNAENPYEGEVELRLEPEGGAPWVAPVKVRAGGEITVAAARTEGAP